jgi:hypothetical protein
VEHSAANVGTRKHSTRPGVRHKIALGVDAVRQSEDPVSVSAEPILDAAEVTAGEEDRQLQKVVGDHVIGWCSIKPLQLPEIRGDF